MGIVDQAALDRENGGKIEIMPGKLTIGVAALYPEVDRSSLGRSRPAKRHDGFRTLTRKSTSKDVA